MKTSSKRRNFVNVDMSQMTEKDKQTTTSQQLNQDKNIYFDPEQSKNGEYIAHCQFTKADGHSKSPQRTTDTKNKNTEDDKAGHLRAEPYIDNKGLQNKLDNISRYKESFPKMDLNTIPVLRPSMIGRMFMSEKMEQIYDAGTKDWLGNKGGQYSFKATIDKLYTALYRKGKNLYTQNLMNLFYTTQRLGGTYIDVGMFQSFLDGVYNQYLH